MFGSLFQNKRGALSVFWIIAIANSLCNGLVFTANLIYQVTTVGLTPLQLVLVGTTLEITYFIFQIPTGIAADLYSRRRSVIIGYCLIGIGFLVEGLMPRFEGILLAQVIWGAGAAFTSGAEEAWISDEVGEDGAAQAFVRAARIGSIGGIAGIVFSVLLGSLQINFPIVAGGCGFLILTGFLIMFMPETGFRPRPRTSVGWRQPLIDTLRTGARLTRAQPVLQIIIAIGLFYGLYSEAFDRLWTDHMLTNFVFPVIGGWQPVVWFGLMRIGVQILSTIGTGVIERRGDAATSATQVRALSVISVVQVLSLAMFGLSGNFLMGVLTFWLFGTLRSMAGPLWTGWINRQMASEVRATMHSFAGQIDAFGQIVGGPVIGSATNALIVPLGLGSALRIGLLIAAITLSPTIALYARVIAREKSLAQ